MDNGTELATEVSRVTDKSSYSIPEDGSPITISTRKKRSDKDEITKTNHPSQTSLLIEYFEGGKNDQGRRPSVRVKVTPSSKSRLRSGKEGDHIQITETKGSGRKPSYTQRINLTPSTVKDKLFGEDQELRSLNSYGSQTEESNLTSRSGHPIEIEVMPPRRHGSPLIPTGESAVSSSNIKIQSLGSDVSSMPADSFLDGKTRSPERKRSKSLSRTEAVMAGAATGVAAAAIMKEVDETKARRSRSLSRERVTKGSELSGLSYSEKSSHRESSSHREKSDRRHKHRESRSRSVSNSSKHEQVKSPRRRSSRTHKEESLLSASDPSQVTNSGLSAGSYKSGHSHSKVSSINNPKLLETVEDAIRRLILPELTALKKEQKYLAKRDKYAKDLGSPTSSGLSQISRDTREEKSSRQRLSDSTAGKDGDIREGDLLSGSTGKIRKQRSDQSYGSGSPRSDRHTSGEVRSHNSEVHRKSSRDKTAKLNALAAGAGLGALAAAASQRHCDSSSRELVDEREERRRRRKGHARNESVNESYEDVWERPRMPMMSQVTDSDITRSSILSADTERPRSASEEHLTQIREVKRGYGTPDSHTPTRSPNNTLQSLGLKHSNQSVHDLTYITERQPRDQYGFDQNDDKVPTQEDSYDGSYIEDPQDQHSTRDLLVAGAAGAAAGTMLTHKKYPEDRELSPEFGLYDHDYYQEVPPPLRYVPYNQERRGLSPIPQSVASFREEDDQNGRTTRSQSYSTLNHIPQQKSGLSMGSSAQSERRDHDLNNGRHAGLEDRESELIRKDEYSEEAPLNIRAHDWDEQSHAYTDSNLESKRNTAYTTSSMADKQEVKDIGAVPDYVHDAHGAESHVASLVSASNVDGSNVTDNSARSAKDRIASYASYDDNSEAHFMSRGDSPRKQNDDQMIVSTDYDSRNVSPSDYPEYELDDQGRKITMPDYKNAASHNKKDRAIADGAIGAAAGAAMAKYIQKRSAASGQQQFGSQDHIEHIENTSEPLQKSFKDRAAEISGPPRSPRHSIDKLTDYGVPDDESNSMRRTGSIKLGSSALPDFDHPMPDADYYQDDASEHEMPPTTRGAVDHKQQSEEYLDSPATPSRQIRRLQNEAALEEQVTPGLKEAELTMLAAAGAMGVGAAVAQHNREVGHEQDEWTRTSEERKRDTLITNPYEGQSPIGLEGSTQRRELPIDVGADYGVGKLNYGQSFAKDEGYETNARSPIPGKTVGFAGDMADADPFYTPRDPRQSSGMSHGMASPLYDSSMGVGLDRIQNKDILALMDHLTVRDAQRSARDTEILMTLVQAAAEMRNSFQEMRKLILDSEDVIIQEVERNTDKSVQKAINGPRPLPSSTNRSARASQEDYINDIPNKRRNVFRRALQGLSMKSTNDLTHIENMLVRLLGDVEGLKMAQSLARGDSDRYDDYDQEGNVEGDRGYEPEGHAGTSTTSHASQSGHFSTKSGGQSLRFQGRKFSDHRISTVQEDDEEDGEALRPHEQAILTEAFDKDPMSPTDRLMTPARDIRGGSAPLATPPQQYVAPASYSNENTPMTDKSKKHKSNSSAGWIPKISRWSETTASTVANKFRNSGRNSGRVDSKQYQEDFSPHSRSGSNFGDYDNLQSPTEGDKLHSGFSQGDLTYESMDSPQGLTSILPPEEPKYKAERRSLLIEHPQPRQGPTHIYQNNLENKAQDYHTPISPKSLDWGSTTSVNRLPPNANQRYSNQSAQTQDEIPRGPSALSEHDYDSPSTYMRAAAAPARPPKEPVDSVAPTGYVSRGGKLTKPSPLSRESLHSDISDRRYSAASASNERRVAGTGTTLTRPQGAGGLGAKLGVPARKPTGPRVMGSSSRNTSGVGPASPEVEDLTVGRNRNRGM